MILVSILLFIQSILNMLSAIVTTMLVAMAPISELRGAIPLAIGLGLSPFAAYCAAVFGNALIVFPLLLFLKYGAEFAATKSPTLARVLDWVFARTRRRHGAKFEHFGFWALFVFVAIPLPLTGAWTGAVIAYLIDMPIKKAGFAILSGIGVAGLLVLALTMGAMHIF